ncbi:hypothetical protein ABL78_4407 [Leptomonas seymouri]|uniref:NUP-1 protein n=1 Tax=Leptomonas seymouri TaxID=5684 RepID=A0A0N1IKS1_LEPSE|nr:hypothetical protein ABL78_4407 [Leptomonas seymouri]|eukprot:KPI86542.1 hypothetical protein ABL78_4407 [Leptomonas seymouri]
MWDSSYYTAQPHRIGDASTLSTLAPSSRAPPAGVLSPDLARPISVRDLARSRVPAVPPPRASTTTSAQSFGGGHDESNGVHAPSISRTSGGFAGFGVPKARVVYAATSGVLPNRVSTPGADESWPPGLSTHGEASDLTSLAYRNIDHLSSEDLYNIASHLQDAAKRYSNHLSEAYAKRDMYRNQVAELKHELQEKFLQIDLQRRELERSSDALQKLREDNTQLREQLANAEGQIRNMTARLSLQSWADPSVAIRAYQAQLATKEAQLQELMGRLVHESSERLRSESGASPRQSNTLGAAGVEDPYEQQQQQRFQGGQESAVDQRIRGEIAEASAAAFVPEMAALQAELNALRQHNAALQEQLEAQRTTHAQALARMESESAELRATVVQGKQERAEMQDNEDALVAALMQRAPMSKTDFEAFQASYAEMQTTLTRAEATVAALQEKQNASAAQDGYLEVLQQSLATSRAEHQELTEKNRQLQALVENLQSEVQLADTANQLRQQQLETAIAGGEQLAQQVQRTQEARQIETHETIQALRILCAVTEAELQRLRAENEELRRPLQEPLMQPATNSREAPEESANLQQEWSALEAELETLRSARDNLVASRDSLVAEVRDLEERRQAAHAVPAQRSTTVCLEAEAPVSIATDVAPSQLGRGTDEDLAMFRAAQQCIADLQRDLEEANAAHTRVEADVQVQLRALEAKVAGQAEDLRNAQEQQKQSEEAHHLRTVAAAAAQEHLEDVIQALKEELEITQTQNYQLRQSESASKDQYIAQLRQTEQLRERLVELDQRPSDSHLHDNTPPSTQPTSVRAYPQVPGNNPQCNTPTQSTMTTALDMLAEQLADEQLRVHSLASENHRLTEDLHRALTTLDKFSAAHERNTNSAPNASASDSIYSKRNAAAAANGRRRPAAVDLVALVATEHDSQADASSAIRSRLDAAEARASAAAAERDALHQRVSAAEEEVRVAKAALERMAGELSDSVQRAEGLSADRGVLEAENARLRTDLSAAQGAVTEVEKRAAEVEVGAAAAASDSARRVACLTEEAAVVVKENARLKEQLSTARGAVANLADDVAKGSGDAAELKRELELECELRRCAELTVVTVKEELKVALAAIAKLADDLETCGAKEGDMISAMKAREDAFALLKSQCESDGAELVEVRRRGEELQGLLDTTLDRLAREEALVKQLNDNAAELHAERAALTEEVATMRMALETVVVERQDMQERLDATKLGLEQTVELYNERILEDDRLQDELSALTKAFSMQTDEVKRGVSCVLSMSEGFRDVLQAVMSPATETVKTTADLAASCSSSVKETKADVGRGTLWTKQSKSRTVSTINAALAPWSVALEWATDMRQRVHTLESSGTVTKDIQCSASAAASQNMDVATSRSSLVDFVELQGVSMDHLNKLRHALDARDRELALLRSALDEMASTNLDEKERVDHLLEAIQDAKNHVSLAEKEFDEQLQLRSEAIASELVVARRAEERATGARLRAETQLTAVEAELRESQTALRKLEEEKRKLVRETERLSRYSTRLPDPSTHARSGGASHGSSTPRSTALFAANTASRHTVTSSAIEELEQAYALQVSSLQQELLLSRRRTRELEGQEATLRQAYMGLEQQVNELRVDAAEAADLREEAARLRADNADLEERVDQLERLLAASGGGTMQELKQLRQQLKMRETELEEQKSRMQEILISKTSFDFEAMRRQVALRESLSGITTQLAATQAQYSGDRTPRASVSAALNARASPRSASPQDVLSSRIDHLLTATKERDALIERMQAEQLQSRVAIDRLEEQLSEKVAALERADDLVAQYAETIDTLRTAGVSTAARVTTPRRNTDNSLASNLQKRAPVAPPTPLSMQNSGEGRAEGRVGEQPKLTPMPSPAPRQPDLGQALEEEHQTEDDSDTGEVEVASTSPVASRRRTGATGESSRRGRLQPRGTRSISSSGVTSTGSRSPRASSNAGKSPSSRKRAR